MKPLLIIISFLFLTDSSMIHKERLLQIDNNGNISGLPKEFYPAKYDLTKKVLRINDKEIIFPKCISHYFEEQNLNLSASWYHTKDIMPYYINFDIIKNETHSYNILVDLETLELIYIRESIRKGNSTRMSEIELEEQCKLKYRNAIKSLK